MQERVSLKRHLSENRWRYIGGALLLLATSLIQVAIPRISGDVIDRIDMRSIDSVGILQMVGVIAALAVSFVGVRFLSRYLLLSGTHLFDRESRDKMYAYLSTLSMKYFNRRSTGEIMALSTNDLRVVRMALMRTVMVLVGSLFTIAMSIVIMVRTVDPLMTAIVFLPFPFLMLVMHRFGPIMRQRFRIVQESFSDMMRKAEENVSGIRVIKAFVQEEPEIGHFERLSNENMTANFRMIRTNSLFHPLITVLGSISTLLILWAGGMMALDGRITIGDFVASMQYVGNITRPFAMMGMILEVIQQARASYGRIMELFYEKPEITDPAGGEKAFLGDAYDPERPAKLRGVIEMRDLRFTYDEELPDSLHGITLTIRPGETLGVIGHVGSGKSSLAKLITRLYDTRERGMLLIDGHDIRDIPLSLLRRSIGYVPQQNFLFSDTIANNINFAPEPRTREEIEEAARIACVHEMIEELPDGYDSELGERGVNLSGGQKQRISIARALVKDPTILVLDDCLSAVDTQTEERILTRLKPFAARRTTLIIGHRVSTMQHADRIAVLDEGRLVELGTHQELIELGGIYSDIYRKQQLEEKVRQEGGADE
ncbi:MAG: ABC transporter ATP-binding protein [Christensenellales bacterium]|jgi:ATP-binding cassette subfamily B multidrug efflux pump